MKCFPLLIAILVCLSVLMVSILLVLIIKNRKRIYRYWKRHSVWKFVVNIALPFLIPISMAVLPFIFDNAQEKNCNHHSSSFDKIITNPIIILAILAFINVIAQMIIWIKEKKEADIRWENSAAKSAYNNMFKILMEKNTRLRGAYHHGLKHGMLTDSDIPYNIFSQIRTICWEFCNTISEITHIEKKDLSAAFVYRYTYEDVTKKDNSWRWITGKGSKFNTPLTDFTELPGSSFRYLIHNSISTLFYNNKQDAANKGQYMFSYRDDSHKRVGSFLAAKVAFSGNDRVCCEGIIMVHSYGHKFLDHIPRATEEELEELIFDSIFPCYRHMLQAELAMLYFRHETEDDEENKGKDRDKDKNNVNDKNKTEDKDKKKEIDEILDESIPQCNPKVIDETIYCIKDINKKEWIRVKSKKRLPRPDEIINKQSNQDKTNND